MTARRPVAAPLVALAAGLALIWLAAPRLAAGLITAPFDAIVDALGQDADTVPPRALRLAAASRRKALGLFADPHLATSLGTVDFALARAPEAAASGAAVDRAGMQRSVASFAAGLAGAPTEPFAWFQLVYAALYAGAPATTVDPALRTAIVAAPTHPRLVTPRLTIGLANWPHLSPETKTLLARQAELAMRWWPDETPAMVRRIRALAPMREALAGAPALRTEFDLAWTRGR